MVVLGECNSCCVRSLIHLRALLVYCVCAFMPMKRGVLYLLQDYLKSLQYEAKRIHNVSENHGPISRCNNLCERSNVELGFPLTFPSTYKVFIHNLRGSQCACCSEPCKHLDGTQFLGMFVEAFPLSMHLR